MILTGCMIDSVKAMGSLRFNLRDPIAFCFYLNGKNAAD